MLSLGFAIPIMLLLLVALLVAMRDLRNAVRRRHTAGAGAIVTNAGELSMIVAALAVFQQGRPAGLMLSPLGGYILFLGGAALLFVGMTLESLKVKG